MHTFTWRDELLSNIHDKVERLGHFTIYVGDECDVPGCKGTRHDELSFPEYGYTVGLPTRFDHPELVVVGLDVRTTHRMFIAMVDLIASGVRLAPGEVVDFGEVIGKVDVCHDVFPLTGLITISTEYHEAIRYPSPPRALQILWADKNNVFPDDPAFDPTLRKLQPLLSIQPPRRYRRRRLK